MSAKLIKILKLPSFHAEFEKEDTFYSRSLGQRGSDCSDRLSCLLSKENTEKIGLSVIL